MPSSTPSIMYDLGFPTDAIEVVRDLGVELCMTLDWRHQHRKVLDKVRERLEHLRTSFATPSSAPTSLVHEDVDAFGMGCESLAAAYAHRNAAALTESLISGRTLKKELGKRCKAPQVAALNAMARLLHADPGSVDDHSALVRTKNTSLDLKRTSQPAAELAPEGTGLVAEDVPAQQEEAEAEQSAKRRCNSDRHKQHVPQAKMNVDRITVGAFKVDKPHEEPYARHDHNFRRVERLKAAISKELRGKATRQLAATAITNEMYANSYKIDSIGGWRMVQCRRTRKGSPKVQVQYLVNWLPSHVEDWALQLFQDANIQYKSATPACRDALQGDACACEICWTPDSRAYAKGEDNHADMLVCERCQKCFHCQCLHIPDTTGQDLQNKDWICPACEHHPDDPPPSQLLKIEWEPDWEPATHLEELGYGQMMKEWQEANHNQPPARPSDMALDTHLDNLTRQGFPAPWRNTWE